MSPHWIHVLLYEHVGILTEVHNGVIYRIRLMIGPDPPTKFILYVGFMTGVKAGQGQTLTLFCAWYCVVIYALCETLQCHDGKCQVRYFVWSDYWSFVHEARKGRAIMVAGWSDYVGELTWDTIRTKRCHTCATWSCRDSDRRSTVVPVNKIMKQPKWWAISFTVDPTLSTPITCFLGYFEWRAVTKCIYYIAKKKGRFSLA